MMTAIRATKILFIFLFSLYAETEAEEYNYIAPELLEEWIEKKKDIILIDLRSREAFAEGHIPCAVNEPVEEFGTDGLLKYRGKFIVFY